MESINISNKVKSSSTFWLVACVTTFLLLFVQNYFKTHWTRKARLLNQFPGAPVYPFFGNALIMFGNASNFLGMATKYVQTYGKSNRFWKFDLGTFCTMEPEIIQRILASPHTIQKSEELSKTFKIFLGNGLVTANGERAVRDRKQLCSAFDRTMYPEFLEVFNAKSKVLRHVLSRHMEKHKEIDALNCLTYCAADVIYHIALQKDMNLLCNSDEMHSKAIKTMSAGVANRTFKPWRYLPVARNFSTHNAEMEAYRYLKNEIKTGLEERVSNEQVVNFDEAHKSKIFVDLLLDSSHLFTKKDMVEHVITMIAAGSETTATTLNFVLFELALHAELQEKALREIKEVFSANGTENIQLSDLVKLKYVEMCLKESLRKYPLFPVLNRMVPFDIKLENGLTIPKGCVANILVYQLHWDPEIYPKPEIFDPERFTKEASSERHAFSFLPFAKGIRNCIGQRFAMMEAMVVLSHILYNFKVTTSQTEEDIQFVVGLPAKSEPPIKLTFTKRNL